MSELGLEHTDKKLFDICKKNIDVNLILKKITETNNKIAIFGTADFEIMFPNKLSALEKKEDIYVLDKEYSGQLKKITSKKITPEFEIIYLGLKVGGINENSFFKKNQKILNSVSKFSAPIQKKCSELIISSTHKLIEPYFEEKRVIKHSLIILSGMNNVGSLHEMLKSFKDYTPPSKNIEIIVVINGSHDKSVNIPSEILKSDYNLKIINTPQNLGISGGYNEGINIAKGKYITLMQDDITFSQKTWLKELEYYLDNHPKIGLIGGFRGGYYFKNNKVINNDKFASPYIGKGSELIGRCKWKLLKDYVVKVDSVNCMLVMFRKEMGTYNEHLLPNGIEDIEFAFKVRKMGYDVYVTDVGIAHGELLSTTREETKVDFLKKVILKKVTGKEAKQTEHNLSKRLSRAYHFNYFKENYFEMLREIPKCIEFEKVTLDKIAISEDKFKRTNF